MSQLVKETYICVDFKQVSRNNFGEISFVMPFLGLDLINQQHFLSINQLVLPYNWSAITSQNRAYQINNQAISQLNLGTPTFKELIKELNDRHDGVLYFTFDKATSKMTISNKTNSTITLDFTVDNDAHKFFGLDKASYSIPANQALVSNYIVDLSPSDLVFVRTNLTTTFVEYVADERVNKNLLAVIPIQVPLFNNHVFMDGSGLFKVPLNTEGQLIQINLEDRDGDRIIPNSPPYLVLSIQSFIDVNKEALTQQREMVKLQRLQLLLTGQDIINAPTE